MEKKAIIMVGLPGSGKSTITHDSKFFETLFGKEVGAVITILSSDDYIEAKAKELGITYSEAFLDHVKDADRNIKVRLANAIAEGNHIIWDQTNLRKTKRNTILTSIPDDYRKIAVEFIVPFEVICERVKTRGEETGKRIGYGILKNMHETREPVSEDEGFDQHVIITNGTD